MKIVICGSMSNSKKMVEAKTELEKFGHEVKLPRNTEEYAVGNFEIESLDESTENKIKDDLIRDHHQKISESDAVFIVNETKKDIENYIGGNAFLEMGFAHVLNKQIFLLNPIPEMIYTDEIKAMQPTVIKRDFSLMFDSSCL